MKLSKINYKSAIFFGVFAFAIYLILGILQVAVIWQVPEIKQEIPLFENVTFFQAVVLTPLVGGLFTYLVIVLAIYVYNKVAKKYPISWEIKK